MEKSQYSLKWNSFQSSMCAGFSLLQQKEELVDLTLAAEGQLVKVHQIVLGIASPYLKELIQSADCKHPVIFMNNMSYEMLCCILEYIYSGETLIEEKKLPAFLDIAKTFKIKGLEGMCAKEDSCHQEKLTTTNEPTVITPVKKYKIEIFDDNCTKLTEEVQLPTYARNVHLKRETALHSPSEIVPKKKTRKNDTIQKASSTEIEFMDGGDLLGQDFDFGCDGSSEGEETETPIKDSDRSKLPDSTLSYTVSNRGALQLILNRYLYNLHTRKPSKIKRWGCADYRYRKCPAVVFTDNNVVIRRIKLHNHSFHDRRINSKVIRKAVYSAFEAADSSRGAEK